MKPFLLLCVVLYVIIIPYSFAFLKLGLLSKFCFWGKGRAFFGWLDSPRAPAYARMLSFAPACGKIG